jgi:predicted RNase H-like HicB family nuclease
MTAARYPKTVFWSDEDGAYVAVAPDLPGCSALGESGPAAIAELDDAIQAWLEAAAKAGNPIPEPTKPHRLVAAQ